MADFIVDFQITKGTGRDLHFSYCYEINIFRLSRIWKKKENVKEGIRPKFVLQNFTFMYCMEWWLSFYMQQLFSLGFLEN